MTTTLTKTLKGSEILATKPAWAAKALIAEYVEDVSDSMTDYFATTTVKRVFLAWSRTKIDSFKDMRAAAKLFSETAHLAAPGKAVEHREKYALGAGYYLKSTGRYSTGWLVRKVGDWAFNYGEMDVIETPVSAPVAALRHAVSSAIAAGSPVITEVLAAPTMTLNAEKSGVEIRFPSKPAAETLTALKSNGWRWSRFGGLWWRKDSPEARAFAEKLVAA